MTKKEYLHKLADRMHTNVRVLDIHIHSPEPIGVIVRLEKIMHDCMEAIDALENKYQNE